jgi:arylamine N-acetyltransferase
VSPAEPIDVDAYLRRLGVPRRPPSVDALHELHRAHAERVPYEVLEIWLGRPTTLDPVDSVARILRGRGGYCFHLNGAFGLLLQSLGYAVTRHVGGVQGRADPQAGAVGNHLVLTVTGLDGDWLADLGMGDGLHEPLPLTPGIYDQGPFRYALRPSTAEPGGWRFDHDPRGAFLGIDFRPEPTGMSAFAEKHRWLSTAPESSFVRVATVARRDATGVDELRGLRLTRIGTRPTDTVLDLASDYFAALADIFGITLSAADRATLWPRLAAAHEQWVKGG